MGPATQACVRILMYLFNLIFALVGIGLIAIGYLTQLGLKEEYSRFITDSFRYLPIVVMVIGGVIAVVAMFGCTGAAKGSSCLLTFFGVLLVILFILEVTVGALAFYYRDDIAKNVEMRMDEGLKEYSTDLDTQKIFDGVQLDLKCCGVRGPADYKDRIPNSCCTQLAPEQSCPIDDAFQNGCFPALESFMLSSSVYILAVGGVVAVIQLLGIIFACCLASSIKRGYEMV